MSFHYIEILFIMATLYQDKNYDDKIKRAVILSNM